MGVDKTWRDPSYGQDIAPEAPQGLPSGKLFALGWLPQIQPVEERTIFRIGQLLNLIPIPCDYPDRIPAWAMRCATEHKTPDAMIGQCAELTLVPQQARVGCDDEPS